MTQTDMRQDTQVPKALAHHRYVSAGCRLVPSGRSTAWAQLTSGPLDDPSGSNAITSGFNAITKEFLRRHAAVGHNGFCEWPRPNVITWIYPVDIDEAEAVRRTECLQHGLATMLQTLLYGDKRARVFEVPFGYRPAFLGLWALGKETIITLPPGVRRLSARDLQAIGRQLNVSCRLRAYLSEGGRQIRLARRTLPPELLYGTLPSVLAPIISHGQHRLWPYFYK
ncbi:MAG TPA: hypothetical protein VI322_03000 [Candidatus Saccharimonadia bacterium]